MCKTSLANHRWEGVSGERNLLTSQEYPGKGTTLALLPDTAAPGTAAVSQFSLTR